ncbi:ribonuclease HII [Croceivirga lutea]|uniref:ribonuclease HII n=1 Tax=Croceivirga lutea TaxID=1775167 RepID=UPI00163B1E63|nr:ribonuclease HII [Croceivirga lutea]GGG34624.1 ribonuclease HII [Croceivirga lutea]
MLKQFYKLENEAGTDEAGRGCLAGPVTAAAVILPSSFKNKVLNDSKKLISSSRASLKSIIENESICYAVKHVFEQEIDEINILNASIKAMHLAINELTVSPNFIIVDGNRFKKFGTIEHECIVKGDAKFMSIAAASILAKTYRDEYMTQLHHKYPMYNWAKNKGYPTKEHREAIRVHGPSPYHRKSFKLLPEQLHFKF